MVKRNAATRAQRQKDSARDAFGVGHRFVVAETDDAPSLRFERCGSEGVMGFGAGQRSVAGDGQLIPLPVPFADTPTLKPSLLSAVAPPPEGVVIRPAAIDYGAVAPVIGWGTGEPGLANFFRVLGRKGRIPVTIHLLPAIAPEPDRKILARAAHDAIAGALAPSGMAPARV